MDIKLDDLCGEEIADFLQEHLDDMKSVSPPESAHALDLEGLKEANVTFWSAWEGRTLVGCAALKELIGKHGEIKSMRTSAAYRGQGIASKLLHHIESVAKSRGYIRLSLETGSMAYFKPAVLLYRKHGFAVCEPFSNYKKDANSTFMTKLL